MPEIHLSESDYDRIAALALGMQRSAPDLSWQVLDEVDRARLYEDDALPANVVRLGSEVEFLDDSHGEARTVRIVLPPQADIAAGRVSVMTPVGAGLIGMAEGEAISWPCPDGRPRTLHILSVRQDPRDGAA